MPPRRTMRSSKNCHRPTLDRVAQRGLRIHKPGAEISLVLWITVVAGIRASAALAIARGLRSVHLVIDPLGRRKRRPLSFLHNLLHRLISLYRKIFDENDFLNRCCRLCSRPRRFQHAAAVHSPSSSIRGGCATANRAVDRATATCAVVPAALLVA
jgi:hypothetical protein